MQLEPLGRLHRVPLRLRFENQLALEMVSWIQATEFVENMQSVYKGAGGYNKDNEHFGELVKT
jgi:DMSO/TMAO reductase YedYZ molybdopterin-dependent catalytic subunit